MKIQYDGQEYKLSFNENGNVFVLYDDEGEMFDRLDPSGHYTGKMEPNTTWVDEMYLSLLVDNGVVQPLLTNGERIEWLNADDSVGTLCEVIHPEFNDGGYSGFGDFARGRLGQQCQYASRYIEGKLDRYPNLGEGLRFNNGRGFGGEIRPLDASDYHSVRIHRDDMDEFERRYKAYQPDNGFGMRTEVVEWLQNG